MSLNNIPAELLLSILAHVDNVYPLSSSSRGFNASVRDYQASQLRARLSRLPHASHLMSIWTPPLFFRHTSNYNHHYHNHRTQSSTHPAVARSSTDLLNLLCDTSLVPRIDSYISSLEHRARVASRVAHHLQQLLSFATISPHLSHQHTFAERLVLYMWTAQPRYQHDVDGYIYSLPMEGRSFEAHTRRERVFEGLDRATMAWVVQSYNAISRRLRPPCVTLVGGAEGLWLWRMVVREGMEGVLEKLDQRAMMG